MRYALLGIFFVLVFTFSCFTMSFGTQEFPEEISIVIITPETVSAVREY